MKWVSCNCSVILCTWIKESWWLQYFWRHLWKWCPSARWPTTKSIKGKCLVFTCMWLWLWADAGERIIVLTRAGQSEHPQDILQTEPVNWNDPRIWLDWSHWIDYVLPHPLWFNKDFGNKNCSCSCVSLVYPWPHWAVSTSASLFLSPLLLCLVRSPHMDPNVSRHD